MRRLKWGLASLLDRLHGEGEEEGGDEGEEEGGGGEEAQRERRGGLGVQEDGLKNRGGGQGGSDPGSGKKEGDNAAELAMPSSAGGKRDKGAASARAPIILCVGHSGMEQVGARRSAGVLPA